MASTIKVKRSSTASAVPSSLAEGELAANTTDGKLFLGKADTSVVQIGGLDPAGDSMTGDLNMQDNQIIRPKVKDYSMVHSAIGTMSGTNTGYDLSVASYDSKSFTYGSNGVICWGDSGTKTYYANQGASSIVQYTHSTAYDISTASAAGKTLSTSSQEGSVGNVQLSDDGTKAYVLGTSNKTIYQYTLSTAWDISTASYASKSYSVSSYAHGYGFHIGNSGTTLITVSGSTIYQHTLSTAWDISTASYDSKSISVSSSDSTPYGIFWSDDGTKLLFVGDTNDTVYSWSCSTAFDVSTASSGTSFSISAQETGPIGLVFANGGMKMYVGGWASSGKVFQYTSGGTTAQLQTLNCEVANTFSATATSAGVTFTFSNPPASGSAGSFVLELTNGGSGTVTWPASVDWEGGTAPTLTAAGTDILAFYTRDGGTIWHGIVSSLDSK